MVGVIPDTAVGQRCFADAQATAARCPNLRVEGPVAHERIGEVLAGTALFAHSSPVEGFPNTLLECWSRGIPAVSAVDPDGIVEREGLGACRADYDAWERALEERLEDPERRRREGARARTWVEGHHAPGIVHEALAQQLREVLQGVRR